MVNDPSVLITLTKCGKKWIANKFVSGSIGDPGVTATIARMVACISKWWTRPSLAFIRDKNFMSVSWPILGSIPDHWFVPRVKRFVGQNSAKTAKNVGRGWFHPKPMFITEMIWFVEPPQFMGLQPCWPSPWPLFCTICDRTITLFSFPWSQLHSLLHSAVFLVHDLTFLGEKKSELFFLVWKPLPSQEPPYQEKLLHHNCSPLWFHLM